MTEQLGRISFGAKNIFKIVAEDGSLYECRIKGKVLREQEPSYNPLAPGDLAAFQVTDEQEHRGVILRREKRSNAFMRWNPKREAPTSTTSGSPTTPTTTM